jgi:hypothetical protein
MKRQIIKTRPQRPYLIARIAIVIVAIAVLVIIALAIGHKAPAHAAGASARVAVGRRLEQDFQIFGMNPQRPA